MADFLTKHYTSYFPVGRLDWDSTGLMILTNDGEMAERLMHPRYGFERVYETRVEGSVSEATLDKLRQGVKLSDGVVQAEGAVLRSDDKSTWVQVKIREGRNRIVRRVFEKLGHPVMKLRRTVYGPFKLGRLQTGQVRVLTLKEYLQVRQKVMVFKPEAADARPQREHVKREPQHTERRERKDFKRSSFKRSRSHSSNSNNRRRRRAG